MKASKIEELSATIDRESKALNRVPVSSLVNTHSQFPINGDPKSGNLPEMLRNNILSS